jgi:hypothetical protein
MAALLRSKSSGRLSFLSRRNAVAGIGWIPAPLRISQDGPSAEARYRKPPNSGFLFPAAHSLRSRISGRAG